MLAITRFAPQWIDANEAENDRSTIKQNLELATDKRLAETHPDEAVRQLFAEASDAELYAQAAANIAGTLCAATSAQGLASATIVATRTVYEVDARPDGPSENPIVTSMDKVGNLDA